MICRRSKDSASDCKSLRGVILLGVGIAKILTDGSTSSSIAGEGKGGTPYDIVAMEAAIVRLQKKEAEEKAFFPGSRFDVRIPELPKDPEEVDRERVAISKGKATAKQEEERLPAWQEALLVISLTALLFPLFLVSLADPMKPPVQVIHKQRSISCHFSV